MGLGSSTRRQHAALVFADLVHECHADGNVLRTAVMIPDGGKRQALELLQQGEAPGEIAFIFVSSQQSARLQQRHEQGAAGVARANRPGADAIDAGVKEIQADMHPQARRCAQSPA